jgi:hypothetical protein
MQKTISSENKSSVCGLFCPACTAYIANHEDPDRLAYMAKSFGCGPQDMECLGCRSEKLAIHCRACAFKTCAREHGVDFCGECPEGPCKNLKKFQTEKPHRIELWDDHRRIREVGHVKWHLEKMEHYACPQCGTVNSAYDLTWRKCKSEPSCAYVKLHEDSIREYVKNRK